MLRTLTRRARAALVLTPFILISTAYANHGPGASGGGASTISGETLKPGKFELSLREDFTQFERFSRNDAAAHAALSGDFDALRRGYLTSLDASYGLVENLQVQMSVGYFAGEGFIGAENSDDGPEIGTANPHGLTDLTLAAKYRFYRGPLGSFALLAGLKIPTGRDNVALSNGETLSPTDQPGTGSWDFPLALAYSRFLTPQLTLDASTSYLFRTQHDHFKSGDRLDLGFALAYRLTENINSFPQYSLFGETLLTYLQRDQHARVNDPNTGSTTLYFSPGLRIRFNENVALTLAPAIPIWEQHNGDQGKVDYKLTASLSFSF